MEKGFSFVALILVLFILNAVFVSAEYICSNDSEIIEDKKEIDELERKTINGLSIAVIRAEEHAVLGRILAEIIIGAEEISLNNETQSGEIELGEDTYQVTLLNTTDTSAGISVDGDSGTINEEEHETIDDFEVILKEVTGASPGLGSATFIIGNTKVILSNDENPYVILTIGDEIYAVELFSVSSANAAISVLKCKNGEISYVQEEVDLPVENITEGVLNDTDSDENETEVSNLTDTEGVPLGVSQNPELEESIFRKLEFWLSLITIVGVIIGTIILIIHFVHKRTEEI